MESQELELEAPQVHTPLIETREPEDRELVALEQAPEQREPGEQEASVHKTEAHQIEVKEAEAQKTETRDVEVREENACQSEARQGEMTEEGARAVADAIEAAIAGVREFRRGRRDTARGHSRIDAARVYSRHLAHAGRNRGGHRIRRGIDLGAVASSAEASSREASRGEAPQTHGASGRSGKDSRWAAGAGRLGISRGAEASPRPNPW